MLGNIINLIYRWLSTRRWNNYPRIEEFVENEHIALVLHVGYVLTKILNEQWKNINLLYIYKNIFWSSFFTFIYSDIKFDVKKHIKEKYPSIYEKLWHQINDFFDSLILPDPLRADYKLIFSSNFSNNLFNDDFVLENKVLQLAKEIVAKYEISWNISFYPRIYWEIYKEKEKNISDLSKELWIKKLTPIFDYANYLLRLKFAYRWNRMSRTYPVSVLAHLFLVFSFSYILWSLKNLDDKNLEKILTISIMHDIPEALTWDVITPTKQAAEWFVNVLEEIEKDLVNKNIVSLFKDYNFKEEIYEYSLNPFNSEIWKFAKMSDNLSAMFEAKIEKKEAFNKIYYDIKRYLWSLEDRELDYILKYWVDYFDEDVETKWKKFIWIEK
jgi:putative hydrolase of HD superfamily